MTAYPHCPPRQSLRAGLIALAVLLLMAILAGLARGRREAWWDLSMPVHPMARELTVSRSRLFRWRLWAYRVELPARELLGFYETELGRQGWSAEPVSKVRGATLRRYRRGQLWVTLRCASDSEPGLAVSLLLSDVQPSEGEAADRS